jgi:DnaK suppressor protein
MIGKKTRSELRKALLNRRGEILDFRRNLNTSWTTLQEPEKELEEAASKETISWELEQLDDRGQEEIRNIDAALTKMEEGEYGYCESCGKQIAIKRLRAVPWANFCRQCADQRERLRVVEKPAAALSADNEELTDEEVVESIYDELRTDRRVELDELDISCEDGMVFLNGLLPSETKHQILLEIVEDILGFSDVEDNIEIDRVAWERRDRTEDQAEDQPSENEIAIEGKEKDVDTYTSMTTGEPMNAPDKLVPEKR